MTVASGKPTRAEALEILTGVLVGHLKLKCTDTSVERVTGHDGAFIVHTVDAHGQAQQYHSKKLWWPWDHDHPNFLDVRGENPPHVSHYFTEAHRTGIRTWWWSGEGTRGGSGAGLFAPVRM